MFDHNIDVCVPHRMDASRLGDIYNDYMGRADGWVLFMDSDVYLRCHPKWYDICCRAISSLGEEAGFISCITNRIGHKLQLHDEYDGDDIAKHSEIAIKLEQQNRGVYTDATNSNEISGHFILTHRGAWDKSTGFKQGLGVLGTDNSYHRAVRSAGYKVYVMRDLYVYHQYKRCWKNKSWKSGVWDE